MKTLKIVDNLFRIEVFICFNCGFNDFEKYLFKQHKIKIINDDDNSDASTICSGSKIFIWFDRITDYSDIEFIGSLAHEVGHGVFYVLSRADIPIVPDTNEETFLYLQSYYLEEILKKLEKLFNFQKKKCTLIKNVTKEPKARNKGDREDAGNSKESGRGDAKVVDRVRREPDGL